MMKKTCFILIAAVACMIFILPVHGDQPPAAQPAPGIAVPSVVAKNFRFEFEPVLEDTVVTHDFIIENKGNAPLSIEKVKTSCGCTTASYSKTIEPGAEGRVSIKGNTRGYGGRKFSKTITVFTNDPNNKVLKLYISGFVEAFAVIEPKQVFLTGTAEETIQSTVTITPLKQYPFSIVESYTEKNLEKRISFTVEKNKNKYMLTINNLFKQQGRYSGRIHLKTDSSIKPEIVIYVSGVINDKKS